MADNNLIKATDIQFSFINPDEISAWGNFHESFSGWDPKTPVLYHIEGSAGSSDNTGETTTTYTLTFKTQFGAEIKKVTKVSEGDYITYPASPEVAGYTFSGWSQDITVMPAKNTIITALYTVNEYTLTYVIDGVSATTEVAYGEEINISDPTKEHYVFVEWEGMPEDGKMPINGVTIEAVFEGEPHVITIKKGDSEETIDVKYGENVADYITEDPTKEADEEYSYEFAGWEPEFDENTLIEDDIEYVAQYTETKKQYTVAYNIEISGISQTYTAITNDWGTELNVELPTEDGYNFTAWAPEYSSIPTQNVTIKTVKTPKVYTIEYKIDNEVFTSITADYKAAVTTPAPTKIGYQLSDWDTVYSEMPLNGGVANASWIPNTVTVNIAGKDPITGTVGSIVTLPSLDKEGYSVNWDNDQDIAKNLLDGSYVFTIPETNDSEITLTYTEQVNSYDLVVNGNTTKKEYGSVINLSEIVDGVDGEYKESDKYEGLTITVNGVEKTINDTVVMGVDGLTIVVTATPKTYTIRYVDFGDNVIASAQCAYKAAITLEKPDNRSRDGYKFIAWSATAPSTMPSNDITITAQYDLTEVTVHIGNETFTMSINNSEVTFNKDELERVGYDLVLTPISGTIEDNKFSLSVAELNSIENKSQIGVLKEYIPQTKTINVAVEGTLYTYSGVTAAEVDITTQIEDRTASGWELDWGNIADAKHYVVRATRDEEIDIEASYKKIPVTVVVKVLTEQEDGSFAESSTRYENQIWGEEFALTDPTYDTTTQKLKLDVEKPFVPEWSADDIIVTYTINIIKEATKVYYGAFYNTATTSLDESQIMALDSFELVEGENKKEYTFTKGVEDSFAAENENKEYGEREDGSAYTDADWNAYNESITWAFVIAIPSTIDLSKVDIKNSDEKWEEDTQNFSKINHITSIDGADYNVYKFSNKLSTAALGKPFTYNLVLIINK